VQVVRAKALLRASSAAITPTANSADSSTAPGRRDGGQIGVTGTVALNVLLGRVTRFSSVSVPPSAAGHSCAPPRWWWWWVSELPGDSNDKQHESESGHADAEQAR
jgi:hypothetical protein